MFYEWSARYKTTEQYNNYKKGEFVYIVFRKKEIIQYKKIKINLIEFDAAAPDQRFESPHLLVNLSPFSFLGFKKIIKIPLWHASKTFDDLRNIIKKDKNNLVKN